MKGYHAHGDIGAWLPASAWQHFEQLAPCHAALVPFADSICRFNPVYGCGMSVAALEGVLLACSPSARRRRLAR